VHKKVKAKNYKVKYGMLCLKNPAE